MRANIRAFSKRDVDAYAKTLLKTLPCDDIEEAQENVRIVMERLQEGERELWVAEIEGTAVGFMLLEFETEERNVEIDWFDIHPDYQEQGLGTVLVQKAEERVRYHQYTTVSLHTAASNQSMRSFAEKNGFSKFRVLPAFWGEGTEDAYLFQKQVR